MATLYEQIIRHCEHDEDFLVNTMKIFSNVHEHDGHTSKKKVIENYQKF